MGCSISDVLSAHKCKLSEAHLTSRIVSPGCPELAVGRLREKTSFKVRCATPPCINSGSGIISWFNEQCLLVPQTMRFQVEACAIKKFRRHERIRCRYSAAHLFMCTNPPRCCGHCGADVKRGKILLDSRDHLKGDKK